MGNCVCNTDRIYLDQIQIRVLVQTALYIVPTQSKYDSVDMHGMVHGIQMLTVPFQLLFSLTIKQHTYHNHCQKCLRGK